VAGPEAKLLPFPDQNSLVRLVNGQPYRTVAAQPPRPSDMTNLMFIGTEAELRAAFEKAGWSSAVRLSTQSKLETARALIEDRGYKEGPMSVLLLDGQPPGLSLQKGNNTFSQRHHLRIFRRPGTFAGKPVWVCSSTHDIGIDFSERDRTFIHKVDSKIDGERAKVVNDLLFTGLSEIAGVGRSPRSAHQCFERYRRHTANGWPHGSPALLTSEWELISFSVNLSARLGVKTMIIHTLSQRLRASAAL
jgi:hypothetical protein